MNLTIADIGTYARELSIDDRTELWVHCANKGLKPATLQAVGASGLGAAAVEYIATDITNATQQSQRDELVSRLTSAKLRETPPHRAATELAFQLLSTGVAGNDPLAARIAIASGGAAHGKTVALRQAFDIAVAKNARISQSDKRNLRSINLLSKPKGKGLKGLLGG